MRSKPMPFTSTSRGVKENRSSHSSQVDAATWIVPGTAVDSIRLAMFSNRFLIKTMQMVGATRWFIAKPLNLRAILNGAISGVIASALLYILIIVAEGRIPWVKVVHDTSLLLLLFFSLIVVGIAITLFSTNRSVIKYLRMKLDDLY